MKKTVTYLSVLLFFASANVAHAQSVAINTSGTAADASSMLDVTSTSKGMLVPRMMQAQRTAITSPATGLLVYQTDGNSGFYYNGGTPGTPSWILLQTAENVTTQGNIFNGASQLVQMTAATKLPAVDGSFLTNLNGSNIASGTVGTDRLGTGTANNTTYLRGDGTWSPVAASGGAAIQVIATMNFGSSTLSPALSSTGIINYNNVATNVNSQYSPSTGTFTALTTGIYQINASVNTTNASAAKAIYLKVNGVYKEYGNISANGSSLTPLSSNTISSVQQLFAGDQVSIGLLVNGTGTVPAISTDGTCRLTIVKL